MKPIKPAIVLGIASALLVVAFVVWDASATSPGALSAVHASVAGIAEQDCAVCHGDATTTMAQACNVCHAPIAQQIESKSGFHGTLATDATRCGSCHAEHHGADIELAGQRSFTLAGVASRDAFQHEKLDFHLSGIHSTLSCKQCHEHADDTVLAKGCTRFRGETQACATCHEDPHEGRLPECAACHGQEEPFAKVARFKHPASFQLTGSHAALGCAVCHEKDTPFAVEASITAGGEVKVTREARTCLQCHESPHDKGFLARVVGSVAGSVVGSVVRKSGMECATCHPVESPSFHAFDATMPTELHALTGFALEPPHADLRCALCHAPSTLLTAAPPGSDAPIAFRALHPGRAADDCKACHVDPHAGQFDAGPFAGQSCRACHAALAFVPSAFDIPEHARTEFALTGAHEAVACSSCHSQAHVNEPRRFAGTPTECASCHADAHAGSFDHLASAPSAKKDGDGCALCHTTQSFTEISEPFDHARSTKFALRGAHSKLECSSCHPSAPIADATGRTFGRVSETFRGPPRDCATCHTDVHAGAFDGRGQAPRSDCARCHTEESFDSARHGFDHAAETSFALTGAHARANCETCHVPRAHPDAHDRGFGVVSESFPGPVTDCRTCHVDPHGKAFDNASVPAEVDGKRGCLRCHTTETFDVGGTKFDHARWTGFELEGAHARASCASCHAPTGDARGTFAPARGKSCQACHEDPHVGQFAQKGGTDCARCHAATADFHTLKFDHQRDTRFALDATHAKLACSSCHVEMPVESGRKAVRYKPLGTSCGDCHDPRGHK